MISGIEQGVLLSPYTTFKVGGKAEYFAKVGSEEELREVARFAYAHRLPITVIGGGSNIVPSDEGIKGLVIKNEIKWVSRLSLGDDELIEVGAGEEWDKFVAFAVQNKLWGIENLSAIPGTVGATPIQNVGAYGVEVSELITEVRAYDTMEDKFVNMSTADCTFGYRDSIFKSETGKRYIVSSVRYRLSRKPSPRLEYKDLKEWFGDMDKPSLSDIRKAVIAIRSKKFPDITKIGTAGSFFKNPIIEKSHFEELKELYPELPGFIQSDGGVKVSLGWILDKVCNLRGVREGSVGTYKSQSLVLVNFGGATAKEIDMFAKKISERVFEKTKIKIEREVNFI